MSNLKILDVAPLPQGTDICIPNPAPEALGQEKAEQIAAMFKALGDPVRLRIFSNIASHSAGEACVCDIADVGVSQPTVSHHLKKLREAGLLASERRGTWVYYKVVPSALAPLAEMLSLTKHQNIPQPDCCH
ncbi:transcriptional regulator [Streptomyces albidoflavus]|uniref:ArsR/SmtB family transcription factor n=1 Tax=Streptomyces albidoflavus TaxID=1886 RepID=UPI000FF802F6|nr:metalloregulator ArsR/SmtB family transcription factor [Streptomyces albidoflavus]RWZ76539.1 transcriptional regulator [Streptomyces albidoflavus]